MDIDILPSSSQVSLGSDTSYGEQDNRVSPYKQTELSPTPTPLSFIRLLRFVSLPNEASSALSSTALALQDATFTDSQAPPPFVAVSWSHHRPSQRETVTVNGSQRSIPASLARSLEQLGRKKEDATIWVGELCINRSLPGERNYCIRRYGHHFRNAQAVIATLDIDDPKASVNAESAAWFFSIIERMGSGFWSATGLSPRTETPGLGSPGQLIWGVARRAIPELAVVLSELAQKGEIWSFKIHLAALRKCHYWRSAWAPGELYTASEAYFMWHEATIEAKLLAAAMATIEAVFEIDETVWLKGDATPDEVSTCRDLLNHEGDPRLEAEPAIHLLVNFVLSPPTHRISSLADALAAVMMAKRPRKLSDSHDAIYSLLPFLGPKEWPLVVPEYDLHPIKMFARTAKSIITTYNANMLAWASAQNQDYRDGQLPSWCPDFRGQVGGLMVCRGEIDPASISFRASGGSRVAAIQEGLLASDPSILGLMGVLVDKVISVSETWGSSHGSHSHTPSMAATPRLNVGNAYGGLNTLALTASSFTGGKRRRDFDGSNDPEPDAKIARSTGTSPLPSSDHLNEWALPVPSEASSPLARLVDSMLREKNSSRHALFSFLQTVDQYVEESMFMPRATWAEIPDSARDRELGFTIPCAGQVRDPSTNLLSPLAAVLPHGKVVMYHRCLVNVINSNHSGATSNGHATPLDEVVTDNGNKDSIGFRTYLEGILRWSGKKVVRTMKGYVGLANGDARAGDSVVLLNGVDSPVVLREGTAYGGSMRWGVVGECWVGGIMEGQLADSDESVGKSEPWHLI